MSRFLSPVVDDLGVERTWFAAHALEIDPDQRVMVGLSGPSKRITIPPWPLQAPHHG